VNTVEDLRQALSDDVRRLQAPAGLETRVLQQALQSTGLAVPAHWTGRRSAVRTWEPKRGTELAAGIAAVVLAAIVIGSFAYIRAVSHPHTVSPPTPSVPRPSPALAQPLTVNPATPVILFNDAGDNYQVDGMTWDGQSGKLTQVANGGHQPSSGEGSNPAGTLFVAFPNIIDRSGRVVANLNSGPSADPGANMFLGAWADDERHYCQVVPSRSTGTSAVAGMLQLTSPGGSPRNVVQIGTQGPNVSSFTVTVCSVLGDRVVVIQRDQNSIQYWVVQLSSGRVLWTHTLISTCGLPIPSGVTACGLPNVVASRDGRYVAEVPAANTSFIYRPDGSKAEVLPIGPSTIFGANGSPIGTVDASISAFSWDGSLALVVDSNAGRARLSVIRWIDGTVIWTAPDGKVIWGFQSEPGGTSLAILIADPSGYGPPTSGTLYVVASDGRVLAQIEVGGGANGGLLACRPVCSGKAW
jgi:hypothetical protein